MRRMRIYRRGSPVAKWLHRGDSDRVLRRYRWLRLAVVAIGAVAAVSLVALVQPTEVSAKSTFLGNFNSTYGTQGTRIDACTVCHVSNGNTNRNAYGQDWANNGKNFGAVELLDSDNDGWPNLDEIQARTFPGDPNDHPVAPMCNGLAATIVGTAGNDTLVGTAGDDVIVGLGGNDKIIGKSGDDVICGGPGADKIFPGNGADWIDGEGGLGDWVNYASAKRRVVVSLALGTASGQGSDTLAGIERIIGSKFNDRLIGNSKSNLVKGGAGADKIWGKAGADRMWGQGGADVLNGGPGADVANGGPGPDTCSAEVLSSC